MRTVQMIVIDGSSEDWADQFKVIGSIQEVNGERVVELTLCDSCDLAAVDQHGGAQAVAKAVANSRDMAGVMDLLRGDMVNDRDMMSAELFKRLPIEVESTPGIRLMPAPVRLFLNLWQYYIPLTRPREIRSVTPEGMQPLGVGDEVRLAKLTKGVFRDPTLGVFRQCDSRLEFLGSPPRVFHRDLSIAIATAAFDSDYCWVQGIAGEPLQSEVSVVMFQFESESLFSPKCRLWSDPEDQRFQRSVWYGTRYTVG